MFSLINILSAATGEAIQLSWKENVLKSLEVMWKGCLAIFLVIIIVVLAVLLLRYIMDSIEKKKKERETDESSKEV